jgi:hypothetical protein
MLTQPLVKNGLSALVDEYNRMFGLLSQNVATTADLQFIGKMEDLLANVLRKAETEGLFDWIKNNSAQIKKSVDVLREEKRATLSSTPQCEYSTLSDIESTVRRCLATGTTDLPDKTCNKEALAIVPTEGRMSRYMAITSAGDKIASSIGIANLLSQTGIAKDWNEEAVREAQYKSWLQLGSLEAKRKKMFDKLSESYSQFAEKNLQIVSAYLSQNKTSLTPDEIQLLEMSHAYLEKSIQEKNQSAASDSQLNADELELLALTNG